MYVIAIVGEYIFISPGSEIARRNMTDPKATRNISSHINQAYDGHLLHVLFSA
jgi:hypothetical protein